MSDPRDARTPEQVLADAEAYGVDLSLIDAQLRRTPEQRVRMLSDNIDFFREVDRSRAARTCSEQSCPSTPAVP